MYLTPSFSYRSKMLHRHDWMLTFLQYITGVVKLAHCLELSQVHPASFKLLSCVLGDLRNTNIFNLQQVSLSDVLNEINLAFIPLRFSCFSFLLRRTILDIMPFSSSALTSKWDCQFFDVPHLVYATATLVCRQTILLDSGRP
jgi:hypothetical protein